MQSMKFKTETDSHSKAIQEWLFEQGFKWIAHGKSLSYTNKNYLYADANDMSITYGEGQHYFDEHKFTEATVNYKTNVFVTSVDIPVPKSHYVVLRRDKKTNDVETCWLNFENTIKSTTDLAIAERAVKQLEKWHGFDYQYYITEFFK